MKGLKIIPMFAGLLFLSYLGVMFVRENPEEVLVQFWGWQSSSTALGFVILTSALVGMIVSGLLCSVELLVLYMQNQKLKRMVVSSEPSLQHADKDFLEDTLEDDYLEEEDGDTEEETSPLAEKAKIEKPEPPIDQKNPSGTSSA